VSINDGTPNDPPPGAATGRKVQGHRTKYASADGQTYLWVDGFLGTHSVAIHGPLGSLTELYRIADGLRRN
jgi:hypothetical protein